MKKNDKNETKLISKQIKNENIIQQTNPINISSMNNNHKIIMDTRNMISHNNIHNNSNNHSRINQQHEISTISSKSTNNTTNLSSKLSSIVLGKELNTNKPGIR